MYSGGGGMPMIEYERELLRLRARNRALRREKERAEERLMEITREFLDAEGAREELERSNAELERRMRTEEEQCGTVRGNEVCGEALRTNKKLRSQIRAAEETVEKRMSEFLEFSREMNALLLGGESDEINVEKILEKIDGMEEERVRMLNEYQRVRLEIGMFGDIKKDSV